MKATRIANIAKHNTSAAIAALAKKPFSASVSMARKLGVNVAIKENKREFWEEVAADLEWKRGQQCLQH